MREPQKLDPNLEIRSQMMAEDLHSLNRQMDELQRQVSELQALQRRYLTSINFNTGWTLYALLLVVGVLGYDRFFAG